MKTTFVERRNTNNVVFERANKIKNPRKIPGKDIKTYSEYIHFHQNKLLAHTIRADIIDPLRQCTFSEDTIYPFAYKNRRVGRPKLNWTSMAYERLAYKNTSATPLSWKHAHKQHIDDMRDRIVDRTIAL